MNQQRGFIKMLLCISVHGFSYIMIICSLLDDGEIY